MHLLKIGLVISSIAFGGTEALATGTMRAPSVPAGTFQTGSQWITTPDGCSYSRTQAPGYPVQWILILNPHHIGQPNAHVRCKPVLGS